MSSDVCPALPSKLLLAQQAEWLAPGRSRIFRRAAIAHKKRTLDLGAGYCTVTPELIRRSGGSVAAFDLNHKSLRENCARASNFSVNGNAIALPFQNGAFDLIFCQFALLWMRPIDHVLSEISRTLESGGQLIAIEPDYGGMIEYPEEIAVRELWLRALTNAGAEPLIGRMIPSKLERLGFDVQVSLLERLTPPSSLRFNYLRDLLEPVEVENILNQKELISRQLEDEPTEFQNWNQIAFLPVFFILANKT